VLITAYRQVVLS